jgi:hypothetical protein
LPAAELFQLYKSNAACDAVQLALYGLPSQLRCFSEMIPPSNQPCQPTNPCAVEALLPASARFALSGAVGSRSWGMGA